jgi:tetratricopeptide (TPR) repeat protein
MEQFEKIIKLLDKDNLTEEEQNYLNNTISSDKDASRLVAVYNSLKNKLPNMVHIDTEMIGEFILYENGELPENIVIPALSEKIKMHLKECLKCQDEYQSLKDEFIEVVDHIDRNITEEKKLIGAKSILSTFATNKFLSFRYAFTAIAVIAVTYLSLFTISSIATSEYNKNIFSAMDEGDYITRGRTSLTFQKGLDAVQKGSYDDAIKYFENDIEEYSEQGSIFYTYFVKGLTYLKAAESSFIGLFQSFDEDKVNRAIVNLKLSIDINVSGNYENLNLDAHYYLGRAYLLLNNVNDARNHLTIVIESKGKFYKESAELVRKLEQD